MVYVIKSDGEKEKYNPNKIINSVMNAGAGHELATAIADRVSKRVHNNISSKKILDLTLKNLRKNKKIAAKYDLKRSVMLLGPTGFPFEKFFALILKEYGYSVEVGRVLKGKIISHEIDIIAKKKKRYMIECKFHNKHGISTRVKVPLYVYGRFLDLKQNFDFPWLATNTKCTQDSKNYAKGVKMKVTSWNYPKDDSLKDMISKKNLYPITILRDINQRAKEELFSNEIYLVKDLIKYNCEELRRKTTLSKGLCHKIIDEAKIIMS